MSKSFRPVIEKWVALSDCFIKSDAMKTMRMLRDDRGNILILAALSMSMLLSFLAIAIDIGNLYCTQRQLQTFADAAAMGGALEASACGTANCAVIQNAATTALTEGGSPAPTLFLQCAAASGTGLLLTINNGPCALGASDPNNLNKNYVEAIVSEQKPTFFAKIFGVSTVLISARAEAGKSSAASPCLNLTGTSGQTLTLNSGASITDASGSTCGVNVDSNGAPAVMEDSGATVKVGTYTVHGTVTNNGGSYTPTPTTGAAVVPDPIAAEITAGTLTTPTKPATASSTCCGPVNGKTTLQPGYYSSGLNFNGSNYIVTLAPGVYYFDGNMIVGGVNLTGSGVTIYFDNGSLTMNSASTMTLSAPTTGPTAGMLIWQATTDSNSMILDSSSSSSWKGAIYLPGAQLTLNGGSTAVAYGMVEAQSLMLNSAISLSCSLMPGGVCPGGSGAGNGSTTIALAE